MRRTTHCLALLLCSISAPALADCPDPDARLGGDLDANVRGTADAAIDSDADLGGEADAALRVGLRAAPRPSQADLDAALPIAARARATFEAGDLAGALADLQRAYRLSADASLLGMLGLSLKASGSMQAAWIALHRFQHEASAEARAALDARVGAALGELQGQLGAVRVRADVPRGQVFVDGELAAALPLDAPLYLRPGRVRLEIRGEGRLSREVEAQVRMDAETELDVDLPEASAELRGHAAADLAGDVDGRVDADVAADVDGDVDGDVAAAGGFDPWPWVAVAGGATAVLLTAGIVATVLVDGISGDLSGVDCGSMPAVCEGLQADAAIGEAFEFVGYIGAGLGAATGIVVAIVAAVVGNAAGSAGADVDLDCEDEAETVSVTCAPWLGETMGGACRLSF